MEYSYAEVTDCAKRLYAMAHSIIRGSAFVGALAGGLLAGVLGAQSQDGDFPVLAVLVGLVIGGLIGWEIGKTRAVHLRLEAQNALGQMEMHHMAVAQINSSLDSDEIAS